MFKVIKMVMIYQEWSGVKVLRKMFRGFIKIPLFLFCLFGVITYGSLIAWFMMMERFFNLWFKMDDNDKKRAKSGHINNHFNDLQYVLTPNLRGE